MAQRSPTLWKSNTAKTAGIAYSSSATQYNSSTTAYSSANTALDDFGKIAESWSRPAKIPTAFVINPAANTNLYTFDSAVKTYDSASDTYDGIVANQDFGDIQTPTAWSSL